MSSSLRPEQHATMYDYGLRCPWLQQHAAGAREEGRQAGPNPATTHSNAPAVA
ncbi:MULTISPECIES: hypothetical protein [unclassified Streptomyces]|uniref:hypothetical protein n=1 Tax=unclassified Streptomyces TaxID=2593676 RepID=UPI00363DA86D